MFKIERTILEWVEKHAVILFFLAVLIIGCLLRIVGYHFVSDDAELCLLPWYDRIAEGGISEQVGNYNIPYQIIIYILTKLPLKPLHAYKTVSCAFDLAMSLLLGGMVWISSKRKKDEQAVLAFSLTFCSPIVMMNSAVWAQCDSIYTFFGILALFFLFNEKYCYSMIALGFSFAFKLQAVFLFPFFLMHYFYTKKWSIFHFLIVPAVMVVLSLPGLIARGNLWDIIRVYLKQTHTYNRVYVSFPSVYALITTRKGSGDYTMFRKAAILLTIFMLGCGLFMILKKRVNLLEKKFFFGVVLWTLYTCCLFLPNMHERYAYVLEVLSIFYAFLTPMGIVLAIGTNLFSVFTYGNYLFDYMAIPISTLSLVSLLLYFAFTCWLLRQSNKGNPDAHEPDVIAPEATGADPITRPLSAENKQ